MVAAAIILVAGLVVAHLGWLDDTEHEPVNGEYSTEREHSRPEDTTHEKMA